MASNDPWIRKRTCPKKIEARNAHQEPEGENQQQTCMLPGPGIYEPFLPPENRKVEEYVPRPIVANPIKHRYVPKPIVPVVEASKKNKKFAPKKNQYNKNQKRDKSMPTELIPKDSLYWLPILNHVKQPDSKHYRTYFYHTIKEDGQRVKIYSYQTGQIDVYRKGVWVNIRPANQ